MALFKRKKLAVALPVLLILLALPKSLQGEGVKKEYATIETSAGIIEVELWPEIAPKTTENFLGLAKKGYYDETIFHRVIPQFMIQGGDPTGTGAGGESIWGGKFEDECSPSVKFDQSGLLAMANAGPGSNGSQFFITTAETPWLDGKHTIFGKVTEGYSVVEKIEAQGTRSGRPQSVQKVIRIVPGHASSGNRPSNSTAQAE